MDKEVHLLTWFLHNDRPNDNTRSLIILLEWLTAGGNYAKLKGTDSSSGLTKKTQASHFLWLKSSKRNHNWLAGAWCHHKNFKLFCNAVDIHWWDWCWNLLRRFTERCYSQDLSLLNELEPIMLDRQSSHPLASAFDLEYHGCSQVESGEINGTVITVNYDKGGGATSPWSEWSKRTNTPKARVISPTDNDASYGVVADIDILLVL